MNRIIKTVLNGSVLFCCLNIAAQNPAEDFFPYRKGKRWGYCNQDKKVLILPRYKQAGFFNKSYSAVDEKAVYMAIVKKKGFGIIDSNGGQIIPFIYDKIEFLPYSFYLAADKNRWDIISGESSMQLEKDSIAYQYRVQSGKLDTLWSFRNAHPPSVEIIEETKITASEGFYCNPGDKYKITEIAKGSFYLYKQKCWQEENLTASGHGSRYVYRQNTDSIVVDANEFKAINASLNNFLIRKQTGWGLIDYEQRQIIEPVYDKILYDPDPITYAVKQNKKWSIFNSSNGQIVKSEHLYDSVTVAARLFNIVKRNNYWGVYLNYNNREVLIGKRKYADYYLLHRNLIEVRNRKKELVGYVHFKGTRFWN